VGDGSVTLASLNYPSADCANIESLLTSLAFVKSAPQYPSLPVSKILHVCNPRLFPVWDWEVVWRTVLWRHEMARAEGPFRNEFEVFCQEQGFESTTDDPLFLLRYTLWASAYIST